MRTYPNRDFTFVVLAIAFAAAVPSANATNLLGNPGFETSTIYSSTLVLGNFATYQGKWGEEVSTIVTAQGGITPPEGSKMLRMTESGNITQVFQVTNLTSYASIIDNGKGIINMSALLDVDSGVTAAGGSVRVHFFSGANYNSDGISFIIDSITLDTDPDTWETASISGEAVPVNTRWVVSEASFNSALLGTKAGYVDATEMTFTPEPATMSLLALGGLAVLRKRRKPLETTKLPSEDA